MIPHLLVLLIIVFSTTVSYYYYSFLYPETLVPEPETFKSFAENYRKFVQEKVPPSQRRLFKAFEEFKV